MILEQAVLFAVKLSDLQDDETYIINEIHFLRQAKKSLKKKASNNSSFTQ